MEPTESNIKNAIENDAWEPQHEEEALRLIGELKENALNSFQTLRRLMEITESEYLKDVLHAGIKVFHGIHGTFLLMDLTLKEKMREKSPT